MPLTIGSTTLLTLDEAAAALGVDRSTLYRYSKTGEIALLTHGRRTWVEAAELGRYVQRRIDAANSVAEARRQQG